MNAFKNNRIEDSYKCSHSGIPDMEQKYTKDKIYMEYKENKTIILLKEHKM